MIRQATPADAQEIHNIATILSKKSIEAQESSTDKLCRNGFLLYPLTASTPTQPNYAERAQSRHFWVKTNKDKAIISFLMAYTFKRMHNFAQLTPNDKTTLEYFMRDIQMPEDAIYVAQIGTHPEFKRQNIMSDIIQHAFQQENRNQAPIAVAEIAQAPLRNEASSHLFLKNGFSMTSTRNKDTHKPKSQQRISGIFAKNFQT